MIEKELALLQANRAKLEQQMKDAGARAEKLEESQALSRIPTTRFLAKTSTFPTTWTITPFSIAH